MEPLLIASLLLIGFGSGMIYNENKKMESMKFKDANWFIFELLDESDKVVYVGLTKNPEQRLRQLTKLKPHKLHPDSSYGNFYNQNLNMDVIAGFENKKEALEALDFLKQESDPLYLQKKLFRKQICSNAGKITLKSGNHNMQQKYVCEDGAIVSNVWLGRYCAKNGLDKNKAIKL